MNWPLLRDIFLFFGGMGGVLHETLLIHTAERPTLLILFAAMMGLPAFLQGGEATTYRKRKAAQADEPAKPKKHLRWVEEPEDK